MPDLVARVRTTLEERALLGAGGGVLLAVSGGPDSTAMLLAFVEIAPSLALGLGVCTVDHGLRVEALDEARFVEGLARGAGLPFRLERLSPSPHGHDEARRRRYEALERARAAMGLEWIATGHTRTDQAETVLIRILRGTGLAGLAAIPAKRGRLIRPLLDVGRDDVREFLEARGMVACTDPSNEDVRTLRARVRLDLLPRLHAEAPGLERTLAALADEVAAVARPGEVDPAAATRHALRSALRAAGLTAEHRHVDAILRMLRVLPRNEPRAPSCAVDAPRPGPYRLDEIDVEVEVPESLVPARVRNRRPGDRLSSGRKLRDRLVELGVPAALRGFVPLVARGRVILALPPPIGEPAGAHFRVGTRSPLALWLGRHGFV